MARVLVYDHSATILARFQQEIAKAGHIVTARFPRELTVEQVQDRSPDVVVLALDGVSMASGLSKLRAVRDDPRTLHIPAIVALLPDLKMPTDFDGDVGVTVVTYTLEPFNLEPVLAAIRGVVEERS